MSTDKCVVTINPRDDTAAMIAFARQVGARVVLDFGADAENAAKARAMKLTSLSSPDGNVAWQGNSLAHSIVTAGLLRRFFSTFE